ncbi:MAG: LysM peptidoglycan-binding domain-containing protein [bacterium]
MTIFFDKYRYLAVSILLFLLSCSTGILNASNSGEMAIEECDTNKIVWHEIFIQYGLPEYYEYLPCVISNFEREYADNQRAGLWGLTPFVATKYGLIIDENIDQRFDIKLSTLAATKYLRDLLSHFEGDELAAKAFVYGAAYIDDCIKRGAVIDSLDTTRCEIDFKVLEDQFERGKLIEIYLEKAIRVKSICDTLNISKEQFFADNSAIKSDAIWLKSGYSILIDKSLDIDSINSVITELYEIEEREIERNRELLIAIKTAEKEAKDRAIAEEIKRQNAVKTYVVKSGDTLGGIASKYNVKVSDLKKWNNIKSDIIQIGQKIKIYK